MGTGDNVFWQIGSSATLGTGSVFEGDILAYASVTLTTGADVTCGSAIALTGAVTLDTNNITNCSSTGSDIAPESIVTLGLTNPTIAATPEPGSLWLTGTALLGAGGVLRRRHASADRTTH